MIQDITLANGLEQKVAEFNLPPGSLLSAINCRQNRNGSLSKRPGNTKLTNQYQQPNNVGAASVDVSLGGALASHNNELLLTTQLGISGYSPAFGTFNVPQPTSEAAITTAPIIVPRAIQGNLGGTSFKMAPALATDGTYYFYCWVTSAGSLLVTIEHIATGDIVQDQIQPSPGASNVTWAVPLMVGTQFTVVWIDSAKNVKMAGMAAPYTGLFTVSATLVSANAAFTCTIDAIALDSSHFAVGFRAFGSTAEIQAFSAAGVAGSSGQINNTSGGLDIRISLNAGALWMAVNCSDPKLVVRDFNPSTFVSTLGVNGFSVETSATYSISVLGLTANRFAIAYTYSLSSEQVTQCDVVDKTLSAGAGGFVLQSANTTFSSALASKLFQQGGKTYCWLQMYSDSGSSQNASLYGIAEYNQTQWTYVLCDTLIDSAQTNFAHPMRPLGIDAPRFGFAVAQNNVTNAGASFAPLSIAAPATNQWVTVFGKRSTAYVSTWYRTLADFASTVRWKAAELNGEMLQSSGMVCMWDGQRAFENCFTNHVCSPSISASAGGTLTASAVYYYKVVPVQADGSGNLSRGLPSSPLTTATTVANKTITLNLPPLAPTLRAPFASSSTGTKHTVYYEIYRSQPNPAGAVTDIATNYLDTVSATRTAWFTYVDAGAVADTATAQNALLYTFGGAKPAGCVSGALDITAHEGRAWIIDDTGSTLYFTKQIVDGEAVNFTDSFTVPLDDQGIALASMDDKLIIFTKRRIYYLIGQGPNDDGSGTGYDSPQRVHSPVGCIDRRSIVATPDGIMFQSSIGLYLLDRGLNVSFVGQPVADELATYPVVVSANLHPSQPWVYFYVTNAAGNAGERLVFDYRIGQWYTDTLAGVPLSAASVNSGAHYWLDTTGQVWAEDTTGAVFKDNSVWVTMHFETAWQPTQAGKQGWGSLDRLQLLAKKLAPCDAVLSLRQNYQPSASSSFLYFDSAAQPKLPTVEIEMINPPGKQEAFTIAYTDYAPTDAASSSGQGWEVDSMTFQLTAIDEDAKLNRLNDAQRGKRLT